MQLKTKEPDPIRLKEESRRFFKKHRSGLLIIEDCHRNWRLVNDFLSYIRNPHHLLLTFSWSDSPSHDPAPPCMLSDLDSIPLLPKKEPKLAQLLHKEEPDLSHLLDKIEVKGSESEEGIITLFLEQKGHKANNILKSAIRSITKGDLWSLCYALKSLEDNEFKEISRAGIREAIKKDLEGIILIREDLDRGVTYLLPRLLIALSILYRYELLTDIRFLYEKFPYPRTQIKAALDELVEMGQAFAVKNGGAFYGLPHSSLAELYFELRDDSDFVEDVFCMDEVELLTEFSISGSNMRASDLSGTFRRRKRRIRS